MPSACPFAIESPCDFLPPVWPFLALLSVAVFQRSFQPFLEPAPCRACRFLRRLVSLPENQIHRRKLRLYVAVSFWSIQGGVRERQMGDIKGVFSFLRLDTPGGSRRPMAWTHLILGHFSIPNGIARGSAGFVLESKSTVFRNSRTKNWLQLRCVHPIGAGGVKLCSAAPTPSRSRPASAANQQAPTLTRPHKRGRGRQETPLP